MRKVILCFAIFIGLTISVVAQNEKPEFSRWSVSLKPFGMVDPFLTNFTGGVQYSFHHNYLVEFQAGLIHSWFCTYNQKEENIHRDGYRLSAELKYLAFKKIYFSVQGFTNNFTKSNSETVWRYGQSYTEEMEIDKKVKTLGLHLKFGYLLHQPTRKLFFDFYGGIGFRKRTIKMESLPPDGELVDEITMFGGGPFSNDTPGTQNFLSISLGMNVGYKLGKLIP